MTHCRWLPLVCLVAAACSSSPYQDDWGDDVLADGRADGLADDAIPIEFGKKVKGTVDQQSLVLYTIALKKGDEFTGTMNVTKGNLQPHFTLMFGLSSNVSSATFEVDGGTLTKTYDVADSGTYFIAARAFQNKGAGSYELTLECTGGPCAGETATEFLPPGEADDCIARARKCAFADAAKQTGTITPTKARSLFEACLAKLATEDGTGCSVACDDPKPTAFNRPSEVCDDVVSEIPFFAKQDPPCLAELDACLESCDALAIEFGGEDPDEIDIAPFAVCWFLGANSTCPNFAHQHEACGGELKEGSTDECFAECLAIDGAWSDDLDGTCDERCE